MEDVAIPPVAAHPAVERVALAGSRSRGEHFGLSDWDFAVETSDFTAVARDMPALVAGLEPLGEQWEPMGHFPVYQVLLRGPVKVEYLFLGERQEAAAPVLVNAETLGSINTHFWDWIWWLATKASIGRDDLVRQHMPRLFAHLLRPMGVGEEPGGIDAAIRAFVARRDELEGELGVSVPRALEDEIRGAIRRLGLTGPSHPVPASGT